MLTETFKPAQSPSEMPPEDLETGAEQQESDQATSLSVESSAEVMESSETFDSDSQIGASESSSTPEDPMGAIVAARGRMSLDNFLITHGSRALHTEVDIMNYIQTYRGGVENIVRAFTDEYEPSLLPRDEWPKVIEAIQASEKFQSAVAANEINSDRLAKFMALVTAESLPTTEVGVEARQELLDETWSQIQEYTGDRAGLAELVRTLGDLSDGMIKGDTAVGTITAERAAKAIEDGYGGNVSDSRLQRASDRVYARERESVDQSDRSEVSSVSTGEALTTPTADDQVERVQSQESIAPLRQDIIDFPPDGTREQLMELVSALGAQQGGEILPDIPGRSAKPVAEILERIRTGKTEIYAPFSAIETAFIKVLALEQVNSAEGALSGEGLVNESDEIETISAEGEQNRSVVDLRKENRKSVTENQAQGESMPTTAEAPVKIPELLIVRNAPINEEQLPSGQAGVRLRQADNAMREAGIRPFRETEGLYYQVVREFSRLTERGGGFDRFKVALLNLRSVQGYDDDRAKVHTLLNELAKSMMLVK